MRHSYINSIAKFSFGRLIGFAVSHQDIAQEPPFSCMIQLDPIRTWEVPQKCLKTKSPNFIEGIPGRHFGEHADHLKGVFFESLHVFWIVKSSHIFKPLGMIIVVDRDKRLNPGYAEFSNKSAQ